MQDENGNTRTGFRFHLQPVNEHTVTMTESLSDEAAFERAKAKASAGPIEPT